MNTIYKLIIVLFFIVFCEGKGQISKRYAYLYNDVVSELKDLAKVKQQFYGKKFEVLYQEMGHKGIRVLKLVPYNIPDDSRNTNGLRLYFMNDEDKFYAYHNSYAEPYINIVFKSSISQAIWSMGPKYRGNWNEQFYNLVSQLEINEIKFYGLEGIGNRYAEPR